MNINILALDGVFDTGLSIVLDALTTANELAAMQPESVAPVKLSLVGLRKRVLSAQGMSVPVVRPEKAPTPDLVIVPSAGVQDARQPATGIAAP